MKMLYFKRITLVVAVLTVFAVVISCNKKQDISSSGSPAFDKQTEGAVMMSTAAMFNPFNRGVGSPIDMETGNRWIGNYVRSMASSKQNADDIISVSLLKDILSNPACVGIAFYYSVDPRGRTRMIPVGVTSNGRMISSSFDVSGALGWNMSQQWIDRYSGATKAHFFGSYTFDRLFSDRTCTSIKTSFGIDDNKTRALLLSNSLMTSVTKYEDRAEPCPPLCPTP